MDLPSKQSYVNKYRYTGQRNYMVTLLGAANTEQLSITAVKYENVTYFAEPGFQLICYLCELCSDTAGLTSISVCNLNSPQLESSDLHPQYQWQSEAFAGSISLPFHDHRLHNNTGSG